MNHTDFTNLIPVIPNLLYEDELTVIAGGPYAGKSRLSLKLANDLALGQPHMFGQNDPINVLYCSERDWAFNSEQLRTIGLTSVSPTLQFFCLPEVPEEEWCIFECRPLEYIKKHLNGFTPKLIIVDTVPHFQAETKDKNVSSYNFNRRELLMLKRWGATYHAATLALFHSPKQSCEIHKYSDPFDRVLGSTSILASSVAVGIIERSDDDVFQLHLRSHVGMLQSPRSFRYADFKEVTPESIPPKPPSVGPAESVVLSLCPTEPTTRSEVVKSIAEQTSRSVNQVRNIMASLEEKGLLVVQIDIVSGIRAVKRRPPS